MIVIMKLRIKSLPNLVGRRGCVLLQSNAWSCLGSHVARQQWTYELWRSDGGPIFRQMVRSHEIRDRIHVSEQSMDFGGLARWSASHWDKWIFKKKTDVDGNVTVYEARLVAKSFSQVQGVDYDEIFSSVAMLKSVGIMLALAAFMKSGRWMSKQVSLPVFVRKGCMWYNQKGFVDPKDAKRYASSSDPSMD